MERKRVRWTAVIGIVFCAIALERLVRALGMAAGPDLPMLIFLLVLAEGGGALLGGIGLVLLRRFALVGLLLFAVSSIAQMAADLGVYGIRSFFEVLAWSALALGLSALGWIAFTHERSPRPNTREA
jgi:hypothetical protein